MAIVRRFYAVSTVSNLQSVLLTKLLLSFHDVTYFLCWIAKLGLHQFDSFIENGHNGTSSFALLADLALDPILTHKSTDREVGAFVWVGSEP
jgi:hypothetical protein